MYYLFFYFIFLRILLQGDVYIMSKTFVIADLHFGHREMCNICHRPENFEDIIICNWNNIVSPEDTVYVLGDVFFSTKSLLSIGYTDRVMTILNGTKILVKGNHDSHKYPWYTKRGFLFACDTFSLTYNGLKIVFSHKPLIFHDFDLNIHGHLHDLADVQSVCRHHLVSLENNGYVPELLDKIVANVKKDMENNEEGTVL